MTIGRCIETRLAEAVYLLLLADQDVFELCGGVGTAATPTKTARIFFAPLYDARDGSVAAPQINVYPTLGTLVYGVGGVTDNAAQVRIALAKRIDRDPGVVGEIQTACEVRHIEKVLKLGADGTDGQGRLYDPDAADGADGVALYINDTITSTRVSGVPDVANGLVFIFIDIEFEVRQDFSGARI